MATVESWYRYCAWRRSKCPKRKLNVNFDGAELLEPLTRKWMVDKDRSEDLVQATLEFVGEVGELAHLLLEEGLVKRKLDKDSRLLDECGDVFFCACWALDAWDANELVDQSINVFDEKENQPIVHEDDLFYVIAQMSSLASMTANATKKQRYQLKVQNPATQQVRILAVLANVANILHAAGYTVVEALEYNVKKLNARYPAGCTGDGGVR